MGVKTWDNIPEEELRNMSPLDAIYLVNSILRAVEKGLRSYEAEVLVNTLNLVSRETVAFFWNFFNKDHYKKSEEWYLNTPGAIPVVMNSLTGTNFKKMPLVYHS